MFRIPTFLEDTFLEPWLPFPVMNLTVCKDLVQRFAKIQECGVNSHQAATQVIKISILFMFFHNFNKLWLLLVHPVLIVLSNSDLVFLKSV